MYITLGNLAVLKGKHKDALNYFETSLDAVEDDDVETLVEVKKHIGVTYFAVGQFDKAIASFEDALEALSEKEGKSTNLLKSDVWNSMARVYKQKGNLPQAKNFAKLGKRVL
jgi:tetratricopeptide (TPR) repeat protein